MRFRTCFIALFFLIFNTNAQHTNLPLGNSYSTNFNPIIYNDNLDYHTSFQPIIKSDLKFDIDSLLEEKNISDYSSWFLRKLFSEHLIILKGDEYKVIFSPVINFMSRFLHSFIRQSNSS